MLQRVIEPLFRLAGRSLLLVGVPAEIEGRLVSALCNEGAEVTTCTSAWQGLLSLQLKSFDAVIVRLDLAPRDGFWLLARARAEAAAFPKSAGARFVAFGGRDEDKTRALLAGFSAFYGAHQAPEALVQCLTDAPVATPRPHAPPAREAPAPQYLAESAA
jgi:PleD family two-component response regulator